MYAAFAMIRRASKCRCCVSSASAATVAATGADPVEFWKINAVVCTLAVGELIQALLDLNW